MKIKSWQQADEALRELGLRQIERDRLEGTCNEKIAELKARVEPRVAQLDAEIAEARERLEAWCEDQRDEMAPAKQRDPAAGRVWRGVYGKLAWRRCPPRIEWLKKKTEAIVAALKSRRLFACVRTVEEPDKDALMTLDDQTLKAVGCRRTAGEKFEAKPDYAVIEERA